MYCYCTVKCKAFKAIGSCMCTLPTVTVSYGSLFSNLIFLVFQLYSYTQ